MSTLLWIMVLGSVLLLIFLLFLLRRRKFVWALLVLAAGLGAWYGYREYTRGNPDLAGEAPDARIAASQLVKEFEINDSLANHQYLGKIIETTGTVMDVNIDGSGYTTIALGEKGSLSTVRCAMDTAHRTDASQWKPGSSVTIRGHCTGFNKDEMGLGSDVVLNRCVVVDPKGTGNR